MRLFRSLLLLASLVFPVVATADPVFPVAVSDQRVYDGADLLPADTEASLQEDALTYERATSIQLAVVTVPSLEGLAVMDYAQRLHRAWGVGQRGLNNGVLMLYAPTAGAHGQMAISVGYGLEGDLPDAECDRIRRTVLHPVWVAGDRPAAVVAVFRAVQQKLGGTAYAARSHTHPAQDDGISGWWVVLALFVALMALWLWSLARPSSRYGSRSSPGSVFDFDFGSSGGGDSGGSSFGGGDSGGGGSGGDC